MKVDHYGEALVCCIDCNRGGRPGNKKLVYARTPKIFLSNFLGFLAVYRVNDLTLSEAQQILLHCQTF